MKPNEPAIIALVLWLLFVISNAFVLFNSPYPPKRYSPDQTIVASGVGDEHRDTVNTVKRK
jgi:hypothetical protein